jgi:hypothetical protein
MSWPLPPAPGRSQACHGTSSTSRRPGDPGTTPNRLHLPARWARLDDLILDRARENRSQLVFTTARGRDAVFW